MDAPPYAEIGSANLGLVVCTQQRLVCRPRKQIRNPASRFTAWVERNLCADPTLLNPCILLSLRRVWLMRILRSMVAPSATLVAFCDSKMTGCGGIRSQLHL